MDFCATGGGVATEYCHMFPDAEVYTRSLVRLTRDEIEQIKAAAGVGLNDAYLMDGYVYYQGDEGWLGFYNGFGGDSPYITCPVHNQDSWTDFEGSQTEEDLDGDGIPDQEGSEGDGWFDEENYDG